MIKTKILVSTIFIIHWSGKVKTSIINFCPYISYDNHIVITLQGTITIRWHYEDNSVSEALKCGNHASYTWWSIQ
jgi:hypothetical protein